MTLLLSGCVPALSLSVTGNPSLAQKSAGHIGCRASEIQTANETENGTIETWDATCRGHVFVCTQRDNTPNNAADVDDSDTTEVACAPRVAR